MSPTEIYTQRLAERRQSLSRMKERERFISLSRLGVFAAGLITFGLSAGANLFSSWWLLAPLFVFISLAVYHERIIQRSGFARRAAAFYERGLSRLDDSWMKSDQIPYQPDYDPNHPYAPDLDLFGQGSLFELVSIARTSIGKQTLASWLLKPAARNTILQRQAAIEELRNNVDLREDFAVLGPEARTGSEARPLLEWAAAPAKPPSIAIVIAAIILVAVTLFALYAWLGLKQSSYWFVAALALEFLFSYQFRRQTQHVFMTVDRAGRDLRLLAVLLERIEREKFNSGLLRQLQESIKSGGDQPSQEIRKLTRWIEMLDWNRNAYFVPIGAILMWRTQIAFAIELWRAKSGPYISKWVQVVGEVEALLSLASHSFEHPQDPFPEIVEGEPCLEAKQAGHPLIPEKQCVRNDIRLNVQAPILIVSGSNMSGKSTLLRTAGINTVLALAGATVRAEVWRCSVLSIGVSIRIQDSLQTGYSKFYAEISRIRQIMDLANDQLPLLFLLDEILHGTNSSDRLIGAQAIVRGLHQRGAIGMITTHDLALARIADELSPAALNVHFEDHVEDGRIAFDYKIKPGVITKSNAIALMRSVGLEI